MKSMLLFLLGSLIFLTGSAQKNTSGVVNYSETRKLEIKLEGESAQFADMLPKERKTEMALFFTPEESLFKLPEKPEEDVVSTEENGAAVMVKMVQPDNKFYTDLVNGKTIEQRDFMSRIFLIENEIETDSWKMTGNQKTILGYPCQEATTERDSSAIVVWFTPAIPVSTGPGRYIGLPGLVLAVDIDNGKTVLQANSIDLKPVGQEMIEKPKGGKKVTREEFDRIVEEKQKEMQEQYGGSGGVVIKIQR